MHLTSRFFARGAASARLAKSVLFGTSLALGLPALAPRAMAQSTITFDTRYTASNVNMWSGSSPTLINYNKFIGVTWDEKAGPYGGMSYGAFGEPWGLVFSAETSGKIGFDVMFKSTSGHMNIDLPNTISLDIPDFNLPSSPGFTPTINVTQNRNVAPGNNILETTFPQAQFSVGAVLKVHASVTADIGYGFGRDSGTVTLSDLTKVAGVLTYNPALLFINPFDLTIPLVSYNVNNSNKIQLLGGLGSIAEKDLVKSFTVPINRDTFATFNSNVSVPLAVEVGNIRFNAIDMDNQSGSSLRSVAQQNEVLAIQANLLGLTTLALGLPFNPFEPKIHIPGTPLLVDATILSVDAGIALGLRQTIELKPQTRLVLQSNFDVTYEVDGQLITTKYLDVLLPDDGGPSAIKVVSRPDDPTLQIYPSVYVSPIALNRVELGLAPTLTVEALKFGISAFGLGGGPPPLFKQILAADPYFVDIFNSTFSLSGNDAFAKRYRILDSIINPGAAVGEDLALNPHEYVTLRNVTQPFATLDIPNGAVLLLDNVGFANTTSLSIASAGEFILKGGANSAVVRGLNMAPNARVTVDAGSTLHNTGLRDANGNPILDHLDRGTPGFVDANGVLANGNFTLRGQLFYEGADITTIGANASLTLIDNAAVGDGTLHLLNNGANPLPTLRTLDGALTLAGPSLSLTGPLSLGGVLDLQAGSTLTTPGLTATGTGLDAGTILLDNATWVDTRGGTFGNVTAGGHLSGINFFLGNNLGGGQFRYTGASITQNATSIVLSGAPQTGGYLARKTTGNNLEEGLKTLNTNTGSLSLLAGAQLTVDNTLNNFSTLVLSGANTRLTLASGYLGNTGIFTVINGATFEAPNLNNISGGVLELTETSTMTLGTLSNVTNPGGGVAGTLGGLGIWNLGGRMDLGSLKINALGADTTLILRTPNANVSGNSSVNDAFSGFSRNNGTMTVREGASFVSTTAFTNTGVFTVSGRSAGNTPVNSYVSFAGIASQTGTINVGTYGRLDTSGADTNNSSLPVDGSNRLMGGTWNIGGNVRYTGADLSGVAAGTTLIFMPDAELPNLVATAYNTNTAGNYFTRFVDGVAATQPSLRSFNSIAGILALSGHTSLRTDSSLTIENGGSITVFPKGTLHVTGPNLTIANGGLLDLGGNLILGGNAGSTTTFHVPDNFDFISSGEIQLGRLTASGGQFSLDGSGNLAGVGTWKNSSALIRGAGTLSGNSVVNRGAIYAAAGTLNFNATNGQIINSGRMGSLREGASTSSLDIANATITNQETIGGNVVQGLLDFQSNGTLSQVTVNGGNIFVGPQGTLSLQLSTLNTNALVVYGTLGVGLGTNYINGNIDLAGQLTVAGGATLVTEFNKTFNNYGTLTVNGAIGGGILKNNRLINVSGANSALGFVENSRNGVINIAGGTNLQASFTYYGNTFKNEGLIHLAPENPATNPNTSASITLWQNTTFNGGGAVQLGGYYASNAVNFTNFEQYFATWSNAGSGTISGLGAGFTLTNQNHTFQGAGNIGGGNLTVVNDTGGTLHAMGAGRELTIQADAGGFTNRGFLDVDSGATLRITGPFHSLVDGALIEGGYRVAGTLVLPQNVGQFDNAVTILIDGASASIAGPNGQNVGIKKNLATGSFTIGSGYNYTLDANGANTFQNDGTLGVRTGSTLFIDGPNFANFSGTTLSSSGTGLASRWVIDGGTLKFNNADVRTNATHLTLGGAAPQIVDQLNSNALANFSLNSGTLAINKALGYALPSGVGLFQNNGTLAVGNNSVFTFGVGLGIFRNTGTLSIFENSTMSFGALTFDNRVALSLADTSTLHASVANLYNKSTITLREASTLIVGASVVNFTNRGDDGTVGLIRVGTGATLRFAGNNVAGLTGTGTAAVTTGRYEVAGTLRFDSGAFTHLGTDLTFFGPSAKIVNSAGANANALSTITASGILTLGNRTSAVGEAQLPNFSAPLTTNHGAIFIGGTAVADGAGGTHETGGALTLTSNALAGTGLITLNSTETSPATLTLARTTAGVFTLDSRLTGHGNIERGGATTGLTLGSSGRLVSDGGMLTVNTPFQNQGYVGVNAGSTLFFAQPLNLVGGSFNVAGEMRIAGDLPSTLPNGFTLNLTGANASVRSNDATGSGYFGQLRTNYATIDVRNQAQLDIYHSSLLINYGSITVADQGILSVLRFENRGLLTIDDAVFQTAGFRMRNDGTIRLNGSLMAGVDGSGDIYIGGAETSSLSSLNTYTGRTIVETGATLAVSQDSQLGTRPDVSLGANHLELHSGATLELQGGVTLAAWRSLSYGDEAVIAGAGTILGPISGTGDVHVGDLNAFFNTSGNINVLASDIGFTFRGTANDITGPAHSIMNLASIIQMNRDYSFGGTLKVKSPALLLLGDGGTTGSFANAAIVNEGTININRSGNLTLGRSFNSTSASSDLLLGGGVQATTTGANNFFAGHTELLSADTKFTFTGGSFAGFTSVGSIVLAPGLGDTARITGAINGSLGHYGTVRMSGLGTGILDRTPDSSLGTLIIDSGTLQIGNGGALSESFLSNHVTNNGTLAFNFTGNGTFGGVATGSGGLTLLSGNLSLFNGQAFTGPVTIKGGKLGIGDDNRLGVAPTTFTAGNIILDGGTLSTSADLHANRGITIGANGGTISTVTSNTVVNLSAPLAGTGAFTHDGPGTVNAKLAASSDLHNYTAARGTLNLSNQNQNTSVRELTVNESATLNLTGTGTTNGSGYLSTVNGTLGIASGTSAQLALAGSGTVNANGSLLAQGSVFAGKIQGTGSFSPSGAFSVNELTVANVSLGAGQSLTVNKIDTDTLTFDGGALAINAGSFSGADRVVVSSLGQVALAGTSTFVIRNELSGGGSLNFNGGGLLGFVNIGTTDVGILHTGDVQFSNSETVTIKTLTGIDAAHTVRLNNGKVIFAGSSFWQGQTNVVSGATLQIGNGGTTGAIGGTTINVGANSYAGFARSDNITLSAMGTTFTGIGGLYQAGPGTLTVSTAAGISGASKISGGTLRLVEGGSIGNGALIEAGGTLLFDYALSDVTFAGPLSGLGTITKNQATRLTLSGTNPFAGTLNIDGGELILTGANTGATAQANIAFGATLKLDEGSSFAGRIVNSGTVNFARVGDFSLSAIFEGTGRFNKTAAGTLTITNAPNYTGAIDIATGATLAFDFNNTSSETVGLLGGVITGNGGLFKSGTGTLVLAEDNMFNGLTTIHNGTLQLGNGGTTGKIFGAFDLRENGTLAFNRSNETIFNTPISGDGSVWQRGAGKLVFAVDQSYIGRTRIDAGTSLQLGNGGSTGNLAGRLAFDGVTPIAAHVVNNGTLFLNRSGNPSFNFTSEGTGTIEQIGLGTVTLTGLHTATGGAIIHTGRTLALGITGSITGPIDNRGTLAIDTDSSPLGRSLDNLSIFGAGDVTFNGTGTTRLTGALGHTGRTNLGTSNLSFTANADSLITNEITSAATSTLTLLGNHRVTLTADSPEFDGTAVIASTLRLGNGGTTGFLGDVAGTATINVLGTLEFNRANALVLSSEIKGNGTIRQMNAGGVTLNNAQQFTGHYLIDSGAGLGLSQIGAVPDDGGMFNRLTVNGTLTWGRSKNLTLTGDIAGSGDIRTTIHAGNVLFTSAPRVATVENPNPGDSAVNFTGSVTAPSGRVVLATNGTMGSFYADYLDVNGNIAVAGNSGLNHNGAFLRTTIATGKTLTLGIGGTSGYVGGAGTDFDGSLVNNGTLAINRSDLFTLGLNNYGGAGGLRQLGSGTTVLSAAGFNGDIAIENGVLEIRGVTSGQIINEATLRINGGSASGAISGSGAVDVRTDVSLHGNLTYTGETTIASGKTLTINANPLTTLAGEIGGAGSLTVLGGTLDLAGGGTYTGATSVGGTLRIHSALASAQIGGAGTLEFSDAANHTLSMALVDSLTLRKGGGGALTLSGTNSTTGNIYLDAGKLIAGSANALNAASNVTFADAAGAALELSSFDLTLGALNGGGSTGGHVTLGSRQLTLAGSMAGNFAGNLSGTGGLTIDGTHTQTLTGHNTYSGATRIANGTLTIGSSNALAASSVVLGSAGGGGRVGYLELDTNITFDAGRPLSIAGPSWLIVKPGRVATFNAPITGSSGLFITGGGLAELNALPTNTGGLEVNSTLKLSAPTINYAGITLSNGTVDLNGLTRTAALTAFTSGALGNSASAAAEFSGTFTAQDGGLTLRASNGDLRFAGTLVNSGAASTTVTTAGTGRVILASSANTNVIERIFTQNGTLEIENIAGFTGLKRVAANNTRVEFAGGSATFALDALTIESGSNADTGFINTVEGSTIRFNVADHPNGPNKSLGFYDNGSGILLGGAGNLYFDGDIEGGGTIAKIGLGKVTLDGDSSQWSGGLDVRAGILAGAQALFNNRSVNILTGAGIEFLAGSGAVNLGALSGAGSVSFGNDGLTLTQNSNTTFSGALTGSGNFTRAGTGELTLSGSVTTGAITFTDGATTISGPLTTGAITANGGTAQITAPTSASSITVGSEGNVTFTNTLSGGIPMTIANNGRLTLTASSITSNGGTTFTGNVDTAGIVVLTNNLGTPITSNAGSFTVRNLANVVDDQGQVSIRFTSNTGTIRVLDGGQSSVAANFTNHGTVAIAGSGANGGSNLMSGMGGGAGTTFTQAAGSLTIGTGARLSTRNLVVNGGTVSLNGTLGTSGATRLIVNGGAVTGTGSIAGSPTTSGLTLSGGSFSPGNSPGAMTVATSAWNGGGNYLWEINDAANPLTGAGTRYDLLTISGALTINATAGNKFTITLASLLANNAAGDVINFNNAINSSYTIATAGSIIGFNANAFTINATGFTNHLNGGSWNLSQVGNNLNLNFAAASAIPEPSTYAMIFGSLVLGLAAYRKRQLRKN
ncbi:beta strand repeat-containing protein [Oleiharenicola lentus]|uniref:beta strand repeat-containing protein n=1 Tax=Oleiharenicola lentus TaxID=2508720 RepID=UPI003F66AD34